MVLNALHHQMILKNNKKKKFEENVSKLVALMENLTVKSLQLASVNFILVNLNQ